MAFLLAGVPSLAGVCSAGRTWLHRARAESKPFVCSSSPGCMQVWESSSAESHLGKAFSAKEKQMKWLNFFL